MKGWKIRKLGEVLALEYGKPLPKEDRDDNGAHPAFGANGVLCRTNRYYHDKPSFIVGRKGSAGEVNLTPNKFWPLDVTYYVTFDETKYDLRFLFHVLRFLNLPSLAKGVKPGINRNDVYDLMFAFPPLSEQQRIVAVLDEAFAGLDAMRANAEKNLQNARDLFDCYLNAIFKQKGGGWLEKTVEEVCIIGDGNHSSNYPKTGDLVDAGIPFIRATNLIDGRVSGLDMRFLSPEKHAQLKKGHLKSGDVLITNRGEIGKIAIVDDAYNNSNLNSQIAWLRCREGLNCKFLFHALHSREIQQHFQSTKSGTALQQFTIKQLKALRLPIPSKSTQQVVVESVESFKDETFRLEALYRQKLAAVVELKQSVLQKAFSGELTSAETIAA